MPCYRPIPAWRQFNETTGTYAINFGRGCLAADEYLSLPCGQCIGCRLERSRRWAIRIMHEAKSHKANSFITLTYNEKNLPENRTLRVEDFQLFMKRLRYWKSEQKNGSSSPLRYFHCGEYGCDDPENCREPGCRHTARPHYHACIFGEDFFADRKPWKKTKAGHQLYISETLSKEWGLGDAYIGELTFESAAYVARYCLKKVTGEQASDHYNEYCPYPPFKIPNLQTGEFEIKIETHSIRKPEYVTMSRRPGIGGPWIEKYLDETYRDDTVIVPRKKKNVECTPPPYYDKVLEKLDPVLHDQVKKERQLAAKIFAESEEAESARLRVREIVKEETIKTTLRRSD